MKAKACTECRQNKLRCLYPTNGIGSCQRCIKKGFACVFDPKFRRITKRKVLKRHSKGEDSTTSGGHIDSNLSTPEPLHLGSIVISGDAPASAPMQDTTKPDCPEPLKVVPCSMSRQIDENLPNTIIAPDDVTKLFDIFLKNNLYFMPLDICLDCDAVYERCPILFWTILFIAGRDFALLPFIQVKLKKLLKDIVLEAVRSVEVIQALLLISHWPFPYRTQLDDQSFTCVSLAVQHSLRLGLHRPTLAHEYSSKDEVLKFGPYKRLTTWLGCFLCCTRESLRHGVPSLITPDYTLIKSFDDNRLPLRLRNLCQLAYQNCIMNNVLGWGGENLFGLLEPTPRLELVKQYIGKLNSVYTSESFVTTRDPYVEVIYLGVRLQVLSYILTDDILSWSTDALQFMNLALTDATRLIRTQSTIPGLEFGPTTLLRHVAYAALVLLKILRECESISLDRKAIQDDLTTAYQIIDRLYSKYRSDEYIIVTKNFLQVYSAIVDIKISQPIKSRGPANLLYNAVRATREAQAQAKAQSKATQPGQHQEGENQNHLNSHQFLFDKSNMPSIIPNQPSSSSENNHQQPQFDPNFVPLEIDDNWLNEVLNLSYYI